MDIFFFIFEHNILYPIRKKFKLAFFSISLNFLCDLNFSHFAKFSPIFLVPPPLKKIWWRMWIKTELGFIGNVFIFKLSHSLWKSDKNFLRFSLFSMGEICKIERREKRNWSLALYCTTPPLTTPPTPLSWAMVAVSRFYWCFLLEDILKDYFRPKNKNLKFWPFLPQRPP